MLGKLLYTPDTALTQGIVRRMNETFESMAGLVLAGKQVSQLLPEVQLLLDLLIAQNFSRDTNATFDVYHSITNMLAAQGLDDLIAMIDPTWFDGFQVNFTNVESWKDRLALLNTLVNNATELLSCFDFDKFVPVATEAALNTKG